jgi:DNA-3-methyladenine glycosylase II
MARATVILSATPPFRLDLTAWALRRRKQNAVDRWDDGQFRRLIVADGRAARLTVTQKMTGVKSTLAVTLESTTRISMRARKDAGLLVQKTLGLAVDLEPFYKLARDDAVIGPLVEEFSGVRPPRFPTVFEGLVNSIACQQVSLDLGIVLLNRLSERFGASARTGGTLLHAFPYRPSWPARPNSRSENWGSVGIRRGRRRYSSCPAMSSTPPWTWPGWRA